MKKDRPAISSLENPLYYLENFRTVLAWVAGHHADLLSPQEHAELDQFEGLSVAAQGLLVRLVMRSGNQFRLSKLSYPELGADERDAARELSEAGWLNATPEIDLPGLFRLFTRAELLQILRPWLEPAGLRKTDTKKVMLEAMTELALEPVPLQIWSPGYSERVLETTTESLFERVRLMFFGNLHQSWSEFVLTELGHQQYEVVLLTPESRAFQHRREVDLYLHLSACRESLAAGLAPEEIYRQVPSEADSNAWLEERRGRLLYALGHQAERDGDIALALDVYSQSGYAEALVRRLRVMERQQQYQQAFPLARHALANPQDGRQVQAINRIYRRLCKKLDIDIPARPVTAVIPTIEIALPTGGEAAVEQAASEALCGPDEAVFYVENWLFNGLFALLCWPALYAPLKGAFFHPFHAAPVDLYRERFVARRLEIFQACLSGLETDRYREDISRTFHDKQGTSCAFIHWPLLGESLLELALACIPAQHLQLIFGRMLDDLRNNRAGIPDLIRFIPEEGAYQLIEVKAPGDRLQDNQKCWFEFFLAHEIPATLCHVAWR